MAPTPSIRSAALPPSGSPPARRRWIRALLLAAPAAAAAAATLWWLAPPDPEAALRAARAPLERDERRPAPELGPGVERWRLRDARGFVADAVWRPSAAPAARWTVVMLGGLATGDRAALLIGPEAPVHVLAVDWPWRGPRRMPAAALVARLPAIRAALLRAPAALALGAEAAARESPGGRVALLGASLGAPVALAALRFADRAEALVLLHGAADLEALLRHELAGRVPRPLATPLAAFAFRLVRPLEPSFHFDAAGDVPTLLVRARDDERLPASAVELLERGLPAAEVVVHSGPHVRTGRTELIEALTAEVTGWLARLPEGPVPAAASPRRGDVRAAVDFGPPRTTMSWSAVTDHPEPGRAP